MQPLILQGFLITYRIFPEYIPPNIPPNVLEPFGMEWNGMELQTICWYGGIGRHNRLKICRTLVRAGSSPATSTVLYVNPHFQLGAEVDSFSLPKIPMIALAEEIFLLKSICV